LSIKNYTFPFQENDLLRAKKEFICSLYPYNKSFPKDIKIKKENILVVIRTNVQRPYFFGKSYVHCLIKDKMIWFSNHSVCFSNFFEVIEKKND